MSIDTPLKSSVQDGELVIRIGIANLANAFERSDYNNPFVDDEREWVQQSKVVNAEVFAKEVAYAMCAEEEDGSTPLTMFLDKMCQSAVEDGAQGIDEMTEEEKA